MPVSHFGEFKSTIKIIEKHFNKHATKLILGKFFKKLLLLVLHTLEKSYDILNKNRIKLDIKKTIMDLEKIHNIKIGDLLKIKNTITAHTNIALDKADLNHKNIWATLEIEDVVMFVGVVADLNSDVVVIKLLKDETIFYVHKDAYSTIFDKVVRLKFIKYEP